MEKLLSIKELSDTLGIPVKTIYNWNTAGNAPKRYKIGIHVKYRASDVEEWLESQVVEHVSSARF